MVAAGQAINSGCFPQAELAKNSRLQPTKAQTTRDIIGGDLIAAAP
jgi:hypothetical protein